MTERPPRMTIATQLVLRVMLQNPAEERHGHRICEEASLASGTVHPILRRLEHHGWLTSRQEQLDKYAAGRPARRYYKLTDTGTRKAHAALEGRPTLQLPNR